MRDRGAGPRAPVGTGGRSAGRIVELLLLFAALPVALRFVHASHAPVPVIPLLVVLGGTVALVLARDPTFDHREALAWRWDRGEQRRILGTFATSAGALLVFTWLAFPERLFELPRERTGLWVVILVFYPLVSVVPQELLFRVFFFHRYGAWLGGKAARIAANAAAFGLAHLLFGNTLAVVLSGVGGALFAWTYARSGSLWLVAFEHALYGCLIFTIGLGQFFYAGP